MEGSNFTACVLCSTSMKGPYFSDQSLSHQLRRAPVSVFKVPYTSYKRPLLQGQKSPYHIRRGPTSVIKVLIYQFQRQGRRNWMGEGGATLYIYNFYIEIPKLEIKNCKDCFRRLWVTNCISPLTFSFPIKYILIGGRKH